jgi:Skp family chaperone for outer membrane proteins
MMRIMTFCLLSLALLSLAMGAAAEDLKIGVLDFQGIFQSYEGYDEAQRIFDKDMETWQALKQQMVDEMLAARENLEVQRLMMTPETQREKEAEFAQMEAELYQFEQEKFGPQGEAVRRNMELSEPIYEKIREVVKTISEEQGYDLVLDVTGAVLYTRPEHSLDEEVTAALKAKG